MTKHFESRFLVTLGGHKEIIFATSKKEAIAKIKEKYPHLKDQKASAENI